jgi:predicted PurR-regulated permease PerM
MLQSVDWFRVLTILLVIIASFIVSFILWTILHAIAHTLLLFLLANVVAFTLAPLVDNLERGTSRRWLAALLVYVGVALVLGSLFVLLAGPFVTQSLALAENLPRYVARLQLVVNELDQFFARFGIFSAGAQAQDQALRFFQESGASLLLNLVNIVGAVANVLVELLLVLVIAFYFLLDGARIQARALALVPVQHRSKALFVIDSVTRVLGGYLRGQLIMSITIGLMVGLGAAVFGLPYALVIGVLAGIFELVPMFGALLGAIPALVIALFQPFPTVLWVALYVFIVQQIENHILVPRITGHAVGLHPLGAIFALLAGLELGGFIGALFAVPVAGILFVLVGTAYRRLAGVEEEPAPRRWWFARQNRLEVPPEDAEAPAPQAAATNIGDPGQSGTR